MRRAGRRRVLLGAALVPGLIVIAGCSGEPNGDGYGCTGRKCTATFDGAGTQDLSQELGTGSQIEVKAVDAPTVTLEAGRLERTLRLKYGTLFPGGLFILVEKIEGDKVTLSVEGY